MARTVRDARSGDKSGLPAWIEPMLASPDGGRLPDSPAYAYEYKYDGYRAAVRVSAAGDVMLTSRNGNDFTPEFPDLAEAAAAALRGTLRGRPAVLDGEIVVLNERGQPDFSLLQQRRGKFLSQRRMRDREQVEAARLQLIVFDLLQLGEDLLLTRTYEQRRRLLTRLRPKQGGSVTIAAAFTHEELAADGLTPSDLLQRAGAGGFEGLVAKERTSKYHPGSRTRQWLKHPLTHTQEVIISGWRPGQGRIAGQFGGLLLGAHDPETGDLVYLGDVGTGFTDKARAALHAELARLQRPDSPFAAELPADEARHARWVEPRIVGEVQYRQFTRGDGRLRHTSWRGLRPDRDPGEIRVPQSTVDISEEPDRPHATPSTAGRRITVRVGDRTLALSNLDKVLYPKDGFTKGEVVNYYSRIAPLLLPHVTGRPVTFIRFPDGVDHEAFFEKDVSRHAPDWVRTVRLPSRGSRGGTTSRSAGMIDYPLLDDLPTLVWAANLAALELHVPQWTVADGPARGLPDRLVFDLDPGPGTSIVDCARVAERIRDILVADGLTPLAKTSGSKGMQLYCGIRTERPEHPSGYAKSVAQALAGQTPKLVTATMAKAQRSGKVFIDWSQNNPAKTTVAPYSLRGREHPTVSTPITWGEVLDCADEHDLTFTADEVLERAARLGDLFAGLLEQRAELPG